MNEPRIFSSAQHFHPADGDPVRSIITESVDTVVVAWYVKPGQAIRAHSHPDGQDTWTVLAGTGDYTLDEAGTTQPIRTGDVVVAHVGEVHGVFNNGTTPLLIVSTVSPADAGYQLAAT